MTYTIQPAFNCRDCVKCGQRPVVEQIKKLYKIKCPNKICKNTVSGAILNFSKWNEQNEPRENLNCKENNGAVKKIA